MPDLVLSDTGLLLPENYVAGAPGSVDFEIENPVNKDCSLNQGLLSWWLVRGPQIGGNTWFDLNGRNHGTLGASTAKPAWTSRGLSFDGGDYVDVAAFSQLDFSCAVWIYPTANGASEQIIDCDGFSNGFRIYRYDANSFAGAVFGFLMGSALAVSNNTWTQFVVTRRGNSCATYVNGGALSSSNSGIGTLVASGPMSIGARRFHDVNFTGKIDDLRLYNRSLSPSEVKRLYADSLAGHPETLTKPRRSPYVAGYTTQNNRLVLETNPDPPDFNVENPVNRDSSLNQGLMNWWLARGPQVGGRKLLDLCGQNHGSFIGSVQWARSTRPGNSNCLAFTGAGAGDKVDVGSLPVLNGSAFTISIWAKVSSSQVDTAMLFGRRGYQGTHGRTIAYSHQTAGKISIGSENDAYILTPSTSPPVDVWNNYVWTFRAGKHIVYLNGVNIGSTTYNFPADYTGVTRFSDDSGNDIDNGQVDDVRVYNRALSPNEVVQLYRDSLTGYPETLNPVGSFGIRGYSYAPPTPPLPLVPREEWEGTEPENVDVNWSDPVNWDCVLNKELVSWWLASGPQIGGGTWFDLCRRNDGALTNSPKWSVSPKSPSLGGLAFSGTSNVNLGSSLRGLPSTAISVVMWANPSSSTNDSYAISLTANGAAIISGYQDGYWNALFGGNYPTGTANDSRMAMTTGAFQHVAYCSDGSRCQGYINGVKLIDVASRNCGLLNGAGIIGAITAAGSSEFVGTISDLRVYGRRLSASEIAQLYQDSLAGYPQTLRKHSTRKFFTAPRIPISYTEVPVAPDPAAVSDVIDELDLENPVNRNCTLNKGLLFWWHGRKGFTGSSWRDIANNTPTSFVGTPTWSAMSQDGVALNLSGTTDHLECSGTAVSSALHGSSQITIMAEIVYDTLPAVTKYDNVLADVYITSGKNGLYLNVRGDGANANKVLVGGRSQAADSFQETTSVSALTAGGRYSIGGILDIANDTITPFINGRLDSSTGVTFGASTYTHTSAGNTNNDSFGGIDNNSGCFDGRIKNIRIWNRRLSASEIAQLYNDSLNGYPQTLNYNPRRRLTWTGSALPQSAPPAAPVVCTPGAASLTLTPAAPTVTATVTTTWIHLPCQDDAASTTVADTSGNAHDGELAFSTTQSYVTAGPGESYPSAFDGASLGGDENPITFPTITWSPSTNNISVGIWVYGPLTGTTGLFSNIDITGGMSIESGVLEFRAPGDGETSTYSLSLGSTATQWHFLHFQFKADGTITVYQNGTLLGDMTLGTIVPIDFALGVLAIDGFTLNRSSTSFCGFKAYNGISTSAQIAADYALGHSNNVTCIPGALSITSTGYASTVLTPRVCIPGPRTLNTTAYEPLIITPRVCIPGKLSLTTAQYPPTALTPRVCIPDALGLATTKYPPTILTPRSCIPGALSLSLTGLAPLALAPRNCIPNALTLSLAGQPPTVGAPRVFIPSALAISTGLYAPTISTPRVCIPSPLALATTAYPPTLLIPKTCIPGLLALHLATVEPVVSTPRTCSPGLASLLTSTYIPRIINPKSAMPGVKSLLISTWPPILDNSIYISIPQADLILNCLQPQLQMNNVRTPGTLACTISRHIPFIVNPQSAIPGVRHLIMALRDPTVIVAPPDLDTGVAARLLLLLLEEE